MNLDTAEIYLHCFPEKNICFCFTMKMFGNLPPGDRERARLPSLRLFIGLCSDSLTFSMGSGEDLLSEERPLSSISCSETLRARGTASLPDNLRGRPRFLLCCCPRKFGEVAEWSLLMEPSGERRLWGKLGPGSCDDRGRGRRGADIWPSLTSARPLILSPSATLRREERFSWSTDTSPRYMNSRRAFISSYLTSLRKTTGCLSGVL